MLESFTFGHIALFIVMLSLVLYSLCTLSSVPPQVLLPWLIEWITVMSLSPHRGIRHTGTEIGMAMLIKLTCLQTVAMRTKIHRERLHASRASSRNEKNGVRKTECLPSGHFEKESQSFADHALTLAEAARSIFENIFLQRYRDTHDEIRVLCISTLGQCMEHLPSTYLADAFLK